MWTSDKHEKFRQKVRDFAENEIRPFADQMDKDNHYPDHLIPKLNQFGLLGLTVSPDYGGSLEDTLTYIIAIEEISRVCGSTGIILAAHNSLGCWPIYAFGTESQKQKYLPDITSVESWRLLDDGA